MTHSDDGRDYISVLLERVGDLIKIQVSPAVLAAPLPEQESLMLQISSLLDELEKLI